MKDEQAAKALEVTGLSVNYDKTSVLWDLTFKIVQGSLVGVIGPNGAGKSTLLKALLGIIKPISGTALFFGLPFSKAYRRIAYVPQRESVDWSFPITVFDVALMGRYGHLGPIKWVRKADRQAAMRILETLGLDSLINRQISQLSGGQQQRLFIARALLQEADLYFLDEPFAGIDKTTEKVIIDVLKGLKNKGKTLLIVHHDLNTVEAYFDSVLILNTSLIAYGEIREAFTQESISQAFGPTGVLFQEALKLSKDKLVGI